MQPSRFKHGNPSTNEAGQNAQRRQRRGGPDAAPHYCHVKGCAIPVAPRFLMCPGHWRRVPAEHQRAVWREYREGQEVTKTPSPAYLEAARKACEAAGFVPLAIGRPREEVESDSERARREAAEREARQAKLF